MKNKRTTKITAAILLCVLIALFFIVCGNLRWETNDDEFFNLIAAGAWGFKNSQYLIYQNIVLGYLFKGLYLLFPGLNVYVLFYLIMNTVSFCLIGKKVAEKHSLALSVVFITGIGLLLHADFFETLQYTKNAFLYAAVGWIYLWEGSVASKKGDCLIGILMLMISFMVRWEPCIFTVPFALAWFLARRNDAGNRMTSVVRSVFFAAAIWAGLYGLNRTAYSSAEWNSFLSYNRVRTSLLDYGIPDYETHAEAYQELDITENDLEVLREWNYGDNKVFSFDNLTAINALKEQRTVSATVAVQAVRDIFRAVHSSILPAVLFMAVVCMVFLQDKEGLWAAFLFLILIVLEYLVLDIADRLVWRVEIGIWLVPVIFLLMMVKENQDAEKKGILLPAVLISICAVGVSGSQLVYNYLAHKHCRISTFYEESRYEEIKELCAMYPQYSFLADTVSFSSYTNHVSRGYFDITKQRYEDLFRHFHIIGSWIYPSPHVIEHEKADGITNPIENLLDENVCFVVETESYFGDEAERIEGLLKTHYDPKAEYEIAGSVDELSVVMFSAGS